MSADPSNSRIYLTASNNPYESIHNITKDPSIRAERQERNDRLIRHRSDAAKRKITPLLKVTPKRSQSSHLVGTEESSSIGPPPAMASLEDFDDDVHRLPESSDEENPRDDPVDIATDGKSNGAKRKQSSPKRPLNTRDINTDGAARRSKRRKTGDEQHLPSTMPEKGSASLKDEDLFFSQISQSQDRKRRNGYSRKYISSQNAFSPTSSAAQTKSGRNTFRSVSESPLPETRASKKSKSKFENVSSSPSVARSPRRKRKLDHVESSPKESENITHAVFQAVEESDSDNQPTSNTTSGTSKSTLFDKSDSKSRRERRGSSSSLSSADSLVEYQLDASQKAALMSDRNHPDPSQPISTATILPPNHVLCPTCRRPTSLLDLDGHSPKLDPSTLSLRRQTKFCYDHRIRDAQSVWKERKYPTINWDTLLTSESLQTQIKLLIPLLRRKRPSHYLSTLDSAITAAKGNQSEINRVFDVTNVHHGYYGPRGAKIITKAIMDDEEVQKQLSRALRGDKSMRIAGLGRLTDCVLVPEVMVGLVQEDLVLGTREEAGVQARQVLEESGELGLLLCGGDDEVDGQEEEEEAEVGEL